MDDIHPAIRGDDRRSMTYVEIATARGISGDSAVRLMRRKRWPKQAVNDGTVRVLDPAAEAVRANTHPSRAHPGGRPPADNLPVVIREAIEVMQPLSALIEAANRRADAERADQAERRLADKDVMIAGLIAELDLLKARRSWCPWRRDVGAKLMPLYFEKRASGH